MLLVQEKKKILIVLVSNIPTVKKLKFHLLYSVILQKFKPENNLIHYILSVNYVSEALSGFRTSPLAEQTFHKVTDNYIRHAIKKDTNTEV